MTRCLAHDHGADGIRVNTLVPGWVMTDKQLKLWVDDAARETIAKSQCLPGPLLPRHIAQMALFLASEASAMCTAQNFIVDGGWT
jgi:NAD(P)-dependent dehydrogenase (short-subunit alcohol dehydrogenase family)